MSFNLCMQLKSLTPFLSKPARVLFIGKRNCSTSIVKSNFLKCKIHSISKIQTTFNYVRTVSSSNLAKANESNTNENSPSDKQNTNVLNDDEFRSILGDFSGDFGVSSDSEQILDDIRKSLEESSSDSDSDKSDEPSIEDKTCSSVQKQKNSNVDPKANLDYPINDKYKKFSESDAIEISSFEELQSHPDSEYVFHVAKPVEYQYSPHELERGITGVYDIDELIEVLRKENLEGITTISVPKELHYTDFLVIATAKSPRHSKAVCERVVKLYKLKKHSKDPFVIVEGEKISNWKALDMGNIVLHIFLEETRALYDIESLWLFDPEFDKGGHQKPDPIYSVIEEQMGFFNSLNKSEVEEGKQNSP